MAKTLPVGVCYVKCNIANPVWLSFYISALSVIFWAHPPVPKTLGAKAARDALLLAFPRLCERSEASPDVNSERQFGPAPGSKRLAITRRGMALSLRSSQWRFILLHKALCHDQYGGAFCATIIRTLLKDTIFYKYLKLLNFSVLSNLIAPAPGMGRAASKALHWRLVHYDRAIAPCYHSP
jgi:hypothetical protein